jgi:hypothetical protein
MTDHRTKYQQKAKRAQAKAQINRDVARKKLLRQREKLAQRRRNNVAQSTARTESRASSANPSKPPTPKYSTVQARTRLYGQRLHRATTASSTANETAAAESEDADDKSAAHTDSTTPSESSADE